MVESIRVPKDRRRAYRRQIVPGCAYERITKKHGFIEDVAKRGEDTADDGHHAGDGYLQPDA